MAAHEEDSEELLEIYSECKRETLSELRDVLVRDIDPTKFYAFLRSKSILDSDDQEEIECEKIRRRKAESFLDVLERKSGGFDALCECLLNKTAGQLHLLEKLLKKFELKIQGAQEFQHTRQLCPIQYNTDFPEPGQIGGPVLPVESCPSVYMSESPPPYTETDTCGNKSTFVEFSMCTL